jgi:hypothetical protein
LHWKPSSKASGFHAHLVLDNSARRGLLSPQSSNVTLEQSRNVPLDDPTLEGCGKGNY